MPRTPNEIGFVGFPKEQPLSAPSVYAGKVQQVQLEGKANLPDLDVKADANVNKIQ